jgi:hypothetical protein
MKKIKRVYFLTKLVLITGIHMNQEAWKNGNWEKTHLA